MTKVLLLTHGGYFGGLEKLEYPIEVSATIDSDRLVFVKGSELIRIGGLSDEGEDGFYPEGDYAFYIGKEADLLENILTPL